MAPDGIPMVLAILGLAKGVIDADDGAQKP